MKRHLATFFHQFKHPNAYFALVSVVTLLGLSSVALIANAQTDSATSTPPTEAATSSPTTTASAPALDTEPEDEMVTPPQSQSVLTARLQQRLTNLAANISNRMEAAIARLSQISNRLERRIDKLAATGVNVSIARGHLSDARADLAAATTILADIDRVVTNALSSENPRSAWLTAKATYQAAGTEIRSAKASLLAAVTALRQAEDGSQTGVVNAPTPEDNGAEN